MFFLDCKKIIEEVLKLNEDPRVHGVYLHLPPACLTSRVLNTIKPEKDVDGYERKCTSHLQLHTLLSSLF